MHAPIDPSNIIRAPELAVIAILDEVITMTIYALCAAHPALAAGEALDDEPPEDERAADRLIGRLLACPVASVQCRRAILDELEDRRASLDISF